MQTIVFLLHSPLVQRDYERFGIEILQKNFNVLVFDMTGLYRPEYFQKKTFNIHLFPGYYSITTRKQCLLLIDQLNPDHAVDFINISWHSFFIRKKLRAKKITITKMQNGLLPIIIGKQPSVPSKILNSVITPNKWKNFFFSFYKMISPASFFGSDSILVGGLAGRNLTAVRYSKHVVPAHSFDYDIYLKLKDIKQTKIQPFAVYIDQDFIYHPNFEFLKIKKFVTEANYYSTLEAFFLDYESKTGIPVKVAVHPRSRYDLHPHLYKGRTLYMGKTAELIRDSKLVLLHTSTSICHAVLWNKPVVFLTTDELNSSSYTFNALNIFRQLFSKELLNMNDYDDMELFRQINEPVDEAKYRNYKDQFIKYPGSPDHSFWEIYSNFLQNKS